MAYMIRAHAKTRSGCINCKSRRVKCDEAKPQCAGCLRHGVDCVYLPTLKRKARSTTKNTSEETSTDGDQTSTTLEAKHPSENAYDTARRSLDLRLMHQYCIFTTQYFASAFPEEVLVLLKVDVPRLAFKHEFLMDAVLLIAIVHLCCSDTVALETLPVCSYRDRALSSLRKEVAQISSQNIDAIRGASVLLATVSFAADRVSGESGLWVVNWLTLASGQRNFRNPRANLAPASSSSFSEGDPRPSLYGAFDDIISPTAIPIAILRALDKDHDRITDGDRAILLSAAEALGRLIGTLQHPYEQSWLEMKVKSWAFDVVSPEFLIMAREERPHALVILAHYLILFKLLPNVWVYEDLAGHDITVMGRTLKSEWQDFLIAPNRALQTDVHSKIVTLLTKSLDAEMENTTI